MATTTTNFGWTVPSDTDLVKDGAAAIRTALGGVDTSFVDLKGGTTGQVLAKNSSTDLDFVWSADASGIPATIFDAKGDLIAASAADTAARLAVGTNGQFLKADSTTATGLAWGSPSSTPNGYTLLNAGGTALSGVAEVTISSISNVDRIIIYTDNASMASSEEVWVRFNADSGSNYSTVGQEFTGNSIVPYWGTTSSQLNCAKTSSNGASVAYIAVTIDSCASTQYKGISVMGMANAAGGSGQKGFTTQGYYISSAAITSVTFGSYINFDAGRVYVYGASL